MLISKWKEFPEMNEKQVIPVRSFKVDNFGTSLATGPNSLIQSSTLMRSGERDLNIEFDQVSAETVPFVPFDDQYKTSIENRLSSYNKAIDILKSVLGGKKVCPRIGVDPGEPMYFAGRLGNEKASSNVFRIGFGGHEGVVVLKILPHSNYYTDPPDPNGEKGIKEILFAQRASDAVRAGETTYFPLVYGKGTCDEAILPRPTGIARESARELYKEAYYWAISRKMIEQLPPANQEFVVKWANGRQPEEVLNFLRANGFHDVTFLTNAPIRAELILMESAWGDLSMYLWKAETVDKEGIHELILDCLYAINYLQRNLKIVHGDLVPENILIQKIEDKDGSVRPRPLITDFGDAKDFTGRDGREERLFDVNKFFRALRNKPTNLTERINVMISLIAYPSKYEHVYTYGLNRIEEMEDVIRYWTMDPMAFMNTFEDRADPSSKWIFVQGNEGKEGDDRLTGFLI